MNTLFAISTYHK